MTVSQVVLSQNLEIWTQVNDGQFRSWLPYFLAIWPWKSCFTTIEAQVPHLWNGHKTPLIPSGCWADNEYMSGRASTLAGILPSALCICGSLLLEHPSPDTQYLTPSYPSHLFSSINFSVWPFLTTHSTKVDPLLPVLPMHLSCLIYLYFFQPLLAHIWPWIYFAIYLP